MFIIFVLQRDEIAAVTFNCSKFNTLKEKVVGSGHDDSGIWLNFRGRSDSVGVGKNARLRASGVSRRPHANRLP